MEEASPPWRRGLFRFREPRTSIIQLRGHRQIVDTEIGRSIYVLADEVELDLVHPAQRRQVDIRPLVDDQPLLLVDELERDLLFERTVGVTPHREDRVDLLGRCDRSRHIAFTQSPPAESIGAVADPDVQRVDLLREGHRRHGSRLSLRSIVRIVVAHGELLGILRSALGVDAVLISESGRLHVGIVRHGESGRVGRTPLIGIIALERSRPRRIERTGVLLVGSGIAGHLFRKLFARQDSAGIQRRIFESHRFGHQLRAVGAVIVRAGGQRQHGCRHEQRSFHHFHFSLLEFNL